MARAHIKFRGLKTTIRNLKKVDKNITGPVRKKMLSEMGRKTKSFVQQELNKISLSGGLMDSMHYRVFQDRVSIWVDASHRMQGYSWDRGMRPHYIHRNMISESGYTVGDWMDSKGISPKRNYLLVGTGRIGQGIQFMNKGADKLRKAMPELLKRYSKEILR